MKRIIVLLTVVALMLAMSTSTAFAVPNQALEGFCHKGKGLGNGVFDHDPKLDNHPIRCN